MARKKLQTYEKKRRFEETPEPKGGEKRGTQERFVVQEHHAMRLHWDFRLERDGVLVSWAVPKGVPMDPKTNHLAVHVEDHPLDYIDFEGEIPAGNYGAGKVLVWDHGTYEVEKWREKEVMVVLHGERVQGRYVLFQTRGKDWMIHRMDPPVDPEAEPMPERIEPMKATLGSMPAAEGDYAFEIKWDGVRTIVYSSPGEFRLESRTGRDQTKQYPELRALGRELGSHSAVLDGEIVALDEQGRPSFQRLQGRIHLGTEAAVKRKAKEVPAYFMAFDVLWLNGRDLTGLPYTDRRELLEGLGIEGERWRTPEHQVGEGSALAKVSLDAGLEGIIAKKLDSRYVPGKRSREWLKIKNYRSTEVVIGGWLPGKAGRAGRIGALLAGVHDDDGRLVYAGRVGTGFTEAELERLAGLLEPLVSSSSPFEGRQPPKVSHFVEPRLVASVEFSEWTNSGTLRQPSYKGLRDDVEPSSVVRTPG
ncbi:MAG: DNA ligase [Thermoleophilaceae bacterium]|nr:DNA ligase [Thermoleophilaceae bacterium]